MVRSFIVLTAFAAASVATVYFLREASREGVGNALDQVKKDVEKATLAKGSYLVQLEEADLSSEDWTNNPLTDKPRPVRLRIRSGGRELASYDLGAFRGLKNFMTDPVSFEVEYDGHSPIEVELVELDLITEGRRFYVKSTWPFAETRIGSGSRLGFTWRLIGDLHGKS